jgi:hypothetical protein
VTGAAIEPLHNRIFSDHRALIVDFDTAQLLGQTLNIAKPKTRLLTSTQKNQCISTTSNSITGCKPKTSTKESTNSTRYKTIIACTQRMEDQAEILNDYITHCMLIAESTIHSHNLDDFSPKKVEAASVENFWKLALQANSNSTLTPTPPMEKIMQNIQTWPQQATKTHLQFWKNYGKAKKLTRMQ